MTPNPLDWIATLCLGLTLLHTFNASRFSKSKNRYLHLLSEVELVFAAWGALYLLLHLAIAPLSDSLAWLENLSFSEPLFVVAILVIASSKPILSLADTFIDWIPKLLPLPKSIARSRLPALFTVLGIGPLLGSLITEPAAMTVCALLMHYEILGPKPSTRLLYSAVAVLFVNISIGGVLTAFAAPPVLMVTKPWGWDTPFMFTNFGLRAILGVVANAALVCLWNRKELLQRKEEMPNPRAKIPLLIFALNLIFLFAIVLASHHPKLLILIFGVTYGYLKLTSRYQGFIQIKSGLMVGAFLAGLAILTADQSWWLTPVITRFSEGPLFAMSTALTAITDNAALTSLAARVSDLSLSSRYFIVAGAVTGGGLTLIANAPNPAGYSILRTRFGTNGIEAMKLFLYALIPTFIAGACLWKQG
jgi:hypothetical protein